LIIIKLLLMILIVNVLIAVMSLLNNEFI